MDEHTRRPELTEAELEQFTDIMLKKVMGFQYVVDDPAVEQRPTEAQAREIVQQVIVDTELLVSGAVPLSRWLAEDDPKPRLQPVPVLPVPD